MNTILHNLRFGLRMLLRQPVFTLAALLTLALGIGANTAIFSVIHGVVLKPLDLPDSERLHQVGWSTPSWFGAIDDQQFRHYAEHQRSFEQFAASTGTSFTIDHDGRGLRVPGLHVSAGYFETFGVLPARGRAILASDDAPGATDTVVLSDGLWRNRLGADPGILGRDLQLDGRPYRVIGVMPAGYDDYSGAELWTPLEPVRTSIGSGGNYLLYGRLRDGVSQDQAQAELAALAQAWRESTGQTWLDGVDFAVRPAHEVLARSVRAPLFVLLGAIGFVLLIACANVANLLLARAQARSREMAVRSAIGASRARLAGQVLTESLLLAVLGAGLGLVIAHLGIAALLGMESQLLPRANEVGIDPWVFGFALLLALVSGLLAGLPQVWQASRRELAESLRSKEALAARPRAGLPSLRNLLVSGQVALALILLVGAGLLIQTFSHLARVDPGFSPERTLAAQFWTSGTRHRDTAAMTALHQALIERVEAIPGVEAAGVVVAGLPLERGGNLGVRIDGTPDDAQFGADYRSVSPRYFDAIGVPVRQGRALAETDSASAPLVVLVNERFAHLHFPDGNAIGQRLDTADGVREIVGIVGDLRSFLDQPAAPTVFLPVAQSPHSLMNLFEAWFPSHLVVRSQGTSVTHSQAVHQAMLEVDATLPIGHLRGMDEVFSAALASQRFHMRLMGSFAGLALLLSVLGIYGVLAYVVGRRTREIGIRVALGASRAGVLSQVLGQGLRPVLAGLALGLFGAWLLSRVIAGMLFGVQALDPTTLVATVLVLTFAAMLACLVPGWRAARTDPMVALRED